MYDAYFHTHAHSHTLGYPDIESKPHSHGHTHTAGSKHIHLGDTLSTAEYWRRALRRDCLNLNACLRR